MRRSNPRANGYYRHGRNSDRSLGASEVGTDADPIRNYRALRAIVVLATILTTIIMSTGCKSGDVGANQRETAHPIQSQAPLRGARRIVGKAVQDISTPRNGVVYGVTVDGELWRFSKEGARQLTEAVGNQSPWWLESGPSHLFAFEVFNNTVDVYRKNEIEGSGSYKRAQPERALRLPRAFYKFAANESLLVAGRNEGNGAYVFDLDSGKRSSVEELDYPVSVQNEIYSAGQGGRIRRYEVSSNGSPTPAVGRAQAEFHGGLIYYTNLRALSFLYNGVVAAVTVEPIALHSECPTSVWAMSRDAAKLIRWSAPGDSHEYDIPKDIHEGASSLYAVDRSRVVLLNGSREVGYDIWLGTANKGSLHWTQLGNGTFLASASFVLDNDFYMAAREGLYGFQIPARASGR